VIVSSDFEQKFLEERFGIKHVSVVPFMYNSGNSEFDDAQIEMNKKFIEQNFFKIRKNFVWIGNFVHFPNFVI
jgi:hypothetical protein